LAVSILFASHLVSSDSVDIPSVFGGIFFIIIFIWLQFYFGLIPFSGDALISSMYLASFVISIVLGSLLAGQTKTNQPNLQIGLNHSIWVAAIISAGIGLVQWLNFADSLGIFVVQTELGTRAAGNLAQPNQLATLLLMGMASLGYVFEKRVIGKTGLIVAVAFLTAVLVLTQSRAGMVSVVAIATFLLWKQRIGTLRLPKQAIFWWVGGFALATLVLPSISDGLQMSGSRSLTESSSISERWLIWKQVAYAIAQAPWFGYGWNQTPTANVIGALAYPGSTTYTNAHDIGLDLMVWCGIPIGMLLIGIMVYWVISRMRAVQKPDAVLAMAALLPIAVHSMLEFPFAYAYFLISAGFFVGIIEAAHKPARSLAIKVRWLWPLFVVWAGIGGYIVYEYFQIEEDFRVVRFENLRVGATPTGYEAPHVRMLSHMAAMLKAARQVPRPDMLPEELKNLRKVSDRFAYGAIRFKYVKALALNGDLAGANKQLRIIRSLYGESFYKASTEELMRLSTEKYPQLDQVKLTE